MAGTLQSGKLAIYCHLVKSSSSGGGSTWVSDFAPRTQTSGNLGAYIPYSWGKLKQTGGREEGTISLQTREEGVCRS